MDTSPEKETKTISNLPRANRFAARVCVVVAVCGAVGCALCPAFARADADPVALFPQATAQENELIFAADAGFWVSPDAATRAAGGSAWLWIGLMNRVFSWLDAELALGGSLLWASDGGFIQTSPQRTAQRAVLPGAAVRAGARLRWPSLSGLCLESGLRAAVYAAPLVGAFTRVELELGLGVDLYRDARQHGTLSLLYGLPLWDGLVEEQGMTLEGWTHHLTLRFGLGF